MTCADASGGTFCFVHAADLHLDTPFKGMGETAPGVARSLREASLEAFDSLVDLCLERQAAFLLLAGDIYDGPRRGIRAQLRFHEGLSRLSGAGIATFVVHGNHDPLESGWSAIGSWPPLVTIFGSEGVGLVPVLRGGREVAVVHGISYGQREVRENLSRRFSRAPANVFQIGLLHCNVRGASEGHHDYSPCSLDDLARSNLDYWALGHVHSRTVMSGRPYGDEPFVVYPGNLQARSPRSSEQGAKGAYVVSVSDGRVTALEFVACDRVRFAEVVVDLAHLSSVEAIRGALGEAAETAAGEAEGRSLVVTGRLTGRSPLHQVLRRPESVEQLLAALRDEFRSTSPFLWWERIVERSAPALDLEELRQGSDFVADLIALADDLASGSEGAGMVPGLEAELPADLLEDITTLLPKGLRSRALATDLPAGELLADGLLTAVAELATGEAPSVAAG
jgi:DNA repair protein SbcD/Mre11